MKERPIIFSGPMVRAILNGKKTQTRRPMNPQIPFDRITTDLIHGCSVGYSVLTPEGKCELRGYKGDEYLGSWFTRPVFGKPGDLLWVRETWRYDDWSEDGEPWIVYAADGGRVFKESPCLPEDWIDRLNDTWADLSKEYRRKGRACDEHWRPSIHMPRWVSRLTLRVTDVRVQRVQEISEEDALAEGLEVSERTGFYLPGNCMYPQWAFRELWNSLTSKPGLTWADNPWVWVVSFERVTP